MSTKELQEKLVNIFKKMHPYPLPVKSLKKLIMKLFVSLWN